MASRKHRVVRNKCRTGKMRYRSQDEAIDHLHRMTAHEGGRIPDRSYWCLHCKGWHLTSQKIEGAAEVAEVPIGDVSQRTTGEQNGNEDA